MNFSCLISCYFGDSSDFLREALLSICKQTVQPSEVVLVEDGILSDRLYGVISEFEGLLPLVRVSLAENRGLGAALAIGLEKCRYPIVARMDSDDICLPNRFEVQLQFLRNNSEVAVVGSAVEEFNRIPGDLKVIRLLPESGTRLLKYAKFRSPVNHPSIMFRKASVLEAGNYDSNIRLFEDFALFARMLNAGHKFHNLPLCLLYFRIGDGIAMIKRRSGFHYIKSELKFLKYAYDIRFLGLTEYILSILLKIPVRLLPSTIVLRIYNVFLRRNRSRVFRNAKQCSCLWRPQGGGTEGIGIDG